MRQLELQLQEDDKWYQEVYEAAAHRVGTLLTDPEHYMNGHVEPVVAPYKVQPERPRGRLDVLRRMSQKDNGPGEHQWQLKGQGLLCLLCGLHIKSCSTHAEIEAKAATVCPGEKVKTLTNIMEDMLNASSLQQDHQPGHRWYLRASSFGCSRCWIKVARRCGKETLHRLANEPCQYAAVTEQDLNLRMRVHPQHQLMQRGQWLECQKCFKVSKMTGGKVQPWMAQECPGRAKQTKLAFAPSSKPPRYKENEPCRDPLFP